MGVVSDVTKRLEVPGEPEAYLEIRMVAWLTLDKARRLRTQEALSAVKAIGGTIDLGGIDIKGVDEEVPDRLQLYDKLTLLKHGVVGWSYPGEIDVEKLDLPTAHWAAREVLDYSLPTAQHSKNGSSPSTGT